MGADVVVEYIRYLIPAEHGNILTADEHCLRHEISRGVENPDRYVVRIEWDWSKGTSRYFARALLLLSSSRS